MKRLHVNLHVDDLSQSTRASISRSASARAVGISHLGIEAEDETELAEVYQRPCGCERPRVEEKGATCCYTRSDKEWIADPQRVLWETFFTDGEAAVYGESSLNKFKEATERAVRCEPSSVEPTVATAQNENCYAPPCCSE